MTTSFIATDVIFKIRWSVAFKIIYYVQAGSLYLLPFALGGKGLNNYLDNLTCRLYSGLTRFPDNDNMVYLV